MKEKTIKRIKVEWLKNMKPHSSMTLNASDYYAKDAIRATCYSYQKKLGMKFSITTDEKDDLKITITRIE